ncbi:MAG: 3'(2'),5'-bisphosphate nucleotidase CysQ, partial [Polyangiaceae bacterium]|nr:3'(2'),5'-bisphosphate nucleotidase CysQ [Polyangiaceae bacterium]
LAAIVARPRVWFIDPLDGTKEFIARNGEFAIMIGLAVGGRAMLGVVAAPATGEVFAGVVGHGAWSLHDDGSRTPLRVSDVNSLGSAGLVKSRSHHSGKLQRVIDALGVQRQVVSGSVGLKAARIASAKEDVYLYMHAPGGAKLWDGCAPEAIVRAAGGEVTDVRGRPLSYAATELELTFGYVATNGKLHDAVIAVTAGYG